ncbi:MAG: hypothetical protein K1000chlam2_00345 [Chlamydiae bacterium]|nr:hypothetical protein [Chlamydiota bacterium]
MISAVESLKNLCWHYCPLPSSITGKFQDVLISAKAKSTNSFHSFHQFIPECENEIFPYYERHEKGFDRSRSHGRMHIARSLIFCEVMGRYYHFLGIPVNFNLMRRAIGLHDAGRQGNTEDVWEKDSAKILKKHLLKKGTGSFVASKQADIVVKDGSQKEYPIEYALVQSGDCLDIMRVLMGLGEKNGFRKELLTFLNHSHAFPINKAKCHSFRDQLIEEVWDFVQITEKKKFAPEFSKNENFMHHLFQVIENNRKKHPVLSIALAKDSYDFASLSFPSIKKQNFFMRVIFFPFNVIRAILILIIQLVPYRPSMR